MLYNLLSVAERPCDHQPVYLRLLVCDGFHNVHRSRFPPGLYQQMKYKNCCCKPSFFTRSFITYSAIVERHMLPWHINNILIIYLNLLISSYPLYKEYKFVLLLYTIAHIPYTRSRLFQDTLYDHYLPSVYNASCF